MYVPVDVREDGGIIRCVASRSFLMIQRKKRAVLCPERQAFRRPENASCQQRGEEEGYWGSVSAESGIDAEGGP